MSEAKKYDRSYKEQSVKLAMETGVKRASEELKVPYGTLYGWVQAAKNGDLDIEERTPENAMSLADDLLKRDFKADKPFSKCVTDITEVKAKETLNKTKSTRSHEYTHRSDFVTLRFIQRVPSIDSFHLKLIIIDIWNF